ncbi:MAG: glycosylphosphatidylinositol anchor biosynthesis [Geoglossum umbratile]|nr:MAG: glycosylphosphatidylinositol anchor biosynthesis [Geoglossum umbratile]
MPPSLQSADGVAPKGQRRIGHTVGALSSQNILLFIVALRIVNSLSIQTFFQPDEYFQSLEPAWQMAFGKESGAWITWEWTHQLRSSIHPAIFAGVYRISSILAALLNLSSWARAELLLAAPKVAQAVIAALGDYYTWKLGERVYGQGGQAAWATPMAVVLHNTYAVELPGDDADSRRAEHVAMALVAGTFGVR